MSRSMDGRQPLMPHIFVYKKKYLKNKTVKSVELFVAAAAAGCRVEFESVTIQFFQ